MSCTPIVLCACIDRYVKSQCHLPSSEAVIVLLLLYYSGGLPNLQFNSNFPHPLKLPFRILFKNYLDELFTYFRVDFMYGILNLFILMRSLRLRDASRRVLRTSYVYNCSGEICLMRSSKKKKKKTFHPNVII